MEVSMKGTLKLMSFSSNCLVIPVVLKCLYSSLGKEEDLVQAYYCRQSFIWWTKECRQPRNKI